MKAVGYILFICLSSSLLACGPQAAPEAAEVSTPPANATMATVNASPTPTAVQAAADFEDLPDSVSVEDGRATFGLWGFSLDLPSEFWSFEPAMYSRTADFEAFVFTRKSDLIDDEGRGFSPSVGIFFYSVPEGTELINFTTILRTQSTNFPAIEGMFGYEGVEPKLNIRALGYHGHLEAGDKNEMYIVHAVNGPVGVQVSFETANSISSQARPEFYSIMESMRFEEISVSPGEDTEGEGSTADSYQSKQSALFISQALISGGGLNLSLGSDGEGKGVDGEGRIYTCSDLALHLTLFQGYHEIRVHELGEIEAGSVNVGDIVIFTESKIPGIDAHAAIVTSLENGMVFVTGRYGPRKDGTYMISGYRNVAITEFLTDIYQTMHIYQ